MPCCYCHSDDCPGCHSMGPRDVEVVTSSCGCVFCDLDLEPEVAGDGMVHVVDCDQYGRTRAVPCTKPVTVAAPATR